jgi:GntR family transcriptional regulator/MocR family aminotransferase
MLEGDTMGSGPLRAGIPDLSTFPHAAWARITRRTLARLSTYLEYGDARGEAALREAIAQHVRQFRGVTTEEQRVIVVEGTQGAIRLVADLLLAEGDRALIEDPCYPFAYAALKARSTELLPVPVDENGMDVALAPAARLALVSPSHQFPLGSRMSLERRRALLDWAQRNDAYVIEDDYDSEYTFDAKPLPTLQSIDRHERVIYVGTFSKTLAPGLRLGYLIVPQHLAELFAVARFVSTLGATRYVQATLADFIAEGHFARYVRRMTRSYGERRRELVSLLEQGLPKGRFALAAGTSGLNLSIIAPPDFDDIAIRDELVASGLWVAPLSSFCISRTDCRGFVIGYSAAPMPEILAGAEVLIAAITRSAS